MEFETSKGVKVVSSFDAMGLREELLRGEQGLQGAVEGKGGGGAVLCIQTDNGLLQPELNHTAAACCWTRQKSIDRLQFVSTAAACP